MSQPASVEILPATLPMSVMQLVQQALADGEVVTYTLLFRVRFVTPPISTAEGALILTSQRLLVRQQGLMGPFDRIRLAEPAARPAPELTPIRLDHIGAIALEEVPGHAGRWQVSASYLPVGGQTPQLLVIDFGENHFLAARFERRLRRGVANTLAEACREGIPPAVAGELLTLLSLRRAGALNAPESGVGRARLL